jgi:rod shape-determining protein MreC
VAVYRRSARPRFLLVLLVLTSVTLLTVDSRGGGSGAVARVRNTARDAFAPVQSAVSDVVSPITDFFHGVFQYRSLEHENALLRQQLAQRNVDQVAAVDAQRERQDLLDLLNLNFVGDVPTVAARVVAGPESNFRDSIVIDRGSDEGLLKGMPVIGGEGLVGQVQQVSHHQATVVLLTDPSFNVGVRLSPSGAIAVASGQGRGKPLMLDLVDPSLKVDIGSTVVTSGLQLSPYPPGIPIGNVLSANTSSPGALEQSVVVRPVMDVGRLSFVKVVLWTPR